jgi:hypothetical protein
MIFAGLRPALFGGAIAMLLCAVTAHGQMNAEGRSAQATIALEFLRLLESGQTDSAHKLLERQVASMYAPARLAAANIRARPPKVRQIRSEGAVESTEAYANKINPRYASLRRGTRPTYVVCLADVPRSGYGRISYVAVILVADPGTSDWKVSDYRYQSEPDHLCRE